MTPFRIHILGCGSALPTLRHNPSSQVVEVHGKFFMVDCGEGTQIALRHTHVHFNKIMAVFISHLHGDHCLGLVGMISSFGLLGRTAPLHVYGPAPLGDWLPRQLDFFTHNLEFEVTVHETDTLAESVIFEDRSLTVSTLPLEHRMPCCGFLFREKAGKRHIRRDMTDFYHIPFSQMDNIRLGADWTDEEGRTIPNERLTTDADPVRSYAYCSDTRYMPDLAQRIKGVTVLYHESTYAKDMLDRAEKYCHSTAEQAATVARDAGAGTLLLGHYSQRYEDDGVLLREARTVFPNSLLTDEKMIFEVK